NISEVSFTNTDQIILVDHNEEAQRVESINNDNVVEIVDHHKININFTKPLRIDVRPLGSTSTVVMQLFKENNVEASKDTKALALAAILSDTQGLKASTTTGTDAEFAEQLAKDLDLDLEKLTFEIFKAKSDITGLTVNQIATKDFKVFEFGTQKVFINQIETVEPETILENAKVYAQELENVKVQHGASQGYIVVTDILKVNSHIIYSNDIEKQIAEEAFTTTGDEFVANIGPKMSRKKDIAPAIEKVVLG
ncbi:DHH family phosphoesterase, partial [candidate division WWE3 bacterium]|nr:DHH family phosphoesterase [candidate division WWE3 bacterium]